MKSGPSHLPLANVNLKGKLFGKPWSCGCCGVPVNLKKLKGLERTKPTSTDLKYMLKESKEEI